MSTPDRLAGLKYISICCHRVLVALVLKNSPHSKIRLLDAYSILIHSVMKASIDDDLSVVKQLEINC